MSLFAANFTVSAIVSYTSLGTAGYLPDPPRLGVSRLIKASTHTSIKLIPDVLNRDKIWLHRRPFHHIHVVYRQDLRCGMCGIGAVIILLQH